MRLPRCAALKECEPRQWDQKLQSEVRTVITVVLADDHQLVRQGVRRLLEEERDIQVVGEADNGIDVQRLVQQLTPDVVLMDVRMRIADGISATREIVRQWPSTHVVILSMYTQDSDVFQALQAGADGYVLKSAGADQVISAVRAAVQGGSVIAPDLTNKVVAEFRRMASKMSPDDGMRHLNDMELKLLQNLTAGLSNKEIANRMGFAESTVKNKLSMLFLKIGVGDRTQAAIYALRHGLAPLEPAATSGSVA
jgi:two-component system, NarL family, response regulator LiaR